MMKKILLVEDDDFFRGALKEILKKKYEVTEAPNGKTAKNILSMQEFDLVLSDIQMPGLTGLELLEWSVKNKPIPFVIMTGFSMLLETQSAFDLGAKGFIAKPFKNAELFSLLESLLTTPSAEGGELIDQQTEPLQFCRVSIEDFVSKQNIDFDVYIKLSEEKFIKIAYCGQKIPIEKIQHYKEKGLKFLYLEKSDFDKLLSFNLGLAEFIQKRADIDNSKKVNFLRYTGEVLLEKTFVTGLDKKSYNDAKSFVDLVLNTLSDSNDYLEILDALNSHSDSTYAHSLGVALFSALIAKNLGLESDLSLFRLVMAGLLHDIGKKEIDKTILEKPRFLVTQKEQELIESHVIRGQAILTAMQTVPSEIIQLVLEHHEDQEGLGFPFKKSKNDQHPLSKVLQCANIFADLTIAHVGSKQHTPQSALHQIEITYGKRVDSRCLAALESVLKNSN